MARSGLIFGGNVPFRLGIQSNTGLQNDGPACGLTKVRRYSPGRRFGGPKGARS
jgi:hypothetical protein